MRTRSLAKLGGRRPIMRALVVGAAALAVTAGVFTAPALAGADESDVEAKAVVHRVPFPCGQKWLGETRTNHSPKLAVDFNRANDFGDTVTASAAGKVVHRGKMAGTSYGRLIVIEHKNGTASYYAHMSKYKVVKNAKVKKGQVIGKVGGSGFPNTPDGFGSHLHYEQRTAYNGSSVKIKFNNTNVTYYQQRTYKSKC